MSIGARIHKVRTRHRMTLRQLAASCGVTVSMLSKVENDRATPSVATLTRLAEALGVNVSLLLADPTDAQTVLTRKLPDSASNWATAEKGYRFAGLCASRIDKAMQPVLFIARKGRVKTGALRHSGEEFVYVLEGRMRYRVGRVTHELGPGDSLYFDAEEEHDLQPLTAEVKYLAVLLPDPPKPEMPKRGKHATRHSRAAH
jgi:transcriptional regulator with XRE-family HTH domain